MDRTVSQTGLIRVLRVLGRPNVGGPALQVVNLALGLDRARIDQRLLVGTVTADEADFLELRAPEIDVVRVPSLGRELRVRDDGRAFARVTREIRRFRPHIVHTHTAKAGVLGRAAARACRVPATVHTFHGHLLRGYFSPAKTRAVVTVERVLARGTTRLVAVGARVRDELLAAGIGRPEQYTVVPPGVDAPSPPARPVARRELGLPQTADVVAFVGRLTAVKRPDRFADVAHAVAQACPEAHFVVAGEGNLLPDLRARTSGLGDRVRFLGWRSDVATVYAAADVVLLTSENEGMPVSLVEAAMCGRPAVTTDVGSAAEVVVDGVTGFVTSLRPAELTAAVLRLLGDPGLRDRMGRAAAERAHREFSATRLVADVQHLYEAIAAQKRFE